MSNIENFKDKKFLLFISAGFLLCIVLAVFISPFASSSPDGLERIAEDNSFLEKSEGAEVWQHSPVPDYTIPGVKNELIATGLSGLLGTLVIFGLAIGFAKIIKKRTK